jgi:uncharacterized membrane protein (GlpM family)
MPEGLKLFYYFLIGGSLTSAIVFFGARGKGMLAAFLTNMPCLTLLAFYLIYREGGNSAVNKYVNGFLYTIPPWILYILAVWFLCPRFGVVPSLLVGVGLYVSISLFLITGR